MSSDSARCGHCGIIGCREDACALRAELREVKAERDRWKDAHRDAGHAFKADLDALRDLRAAVLRVAGELAAAVAEAERPRGGMRVPFLEPLASAIRLPSFVAWARKTAARLTEAAR